MVEAVEVVIKQPGHPDRVVRLQEGATRMGRAEDNEVVLSDVGVSRRHAQVYVSRGEVTVEDLGSGNGTYYNGYRIQSQPIQDGDEIVIDPFVLHFRISGQERAMRYDGEGGAAGGGAAPARLEVVVGTGMAGSSYPITSRGLSIGRSEDRDVVIPDPAASRHHCQITVQGGDYVLRDMGSANGVFVNAVRVRECTLADGDLIRIGNTEMRFVRYDEHASDNTTQVVSSDGWAQQSWNEPGLPPPGSVPHQEAAPRRSRSRPLLAVLFGGLLVLVGFLVVLVLVLAIVVVALQMQPQGPPAFEAEPPRWELTLPPGLEGAPVDALFKAGTEKYRENDHTGALQDFHRVMLADPAYPSIRKFAYAAGENLVLGVLEDEFTRVRRARDERDAERDRLMNQLSSRSRTRQRTARRALEQDFSDDPVVIEALELKAPEQMVEAENKAAAAFELLSKDDFDGAALAYDEVLTIASDPKVRTQALTNLRTAQKEVARASQPQWTEAVLADAAGEDPTAKQLYQALLDAHPANPSAKVRIGRL